MFEVCAVPAVLLEDAHKAMFSQDNTELFNIFDIFEILVKDSIFKMTPEIDMLAHLVEKSCFSNPLDLNYI
jgi:hypothetical protein